MIKVLREFYSVDEASIIFDATISDIWHLIELGKLHASFRTTLCGALFDFANTRLRLRDTIQHENTLMILHEDARKLATFGSTLIHSALIYLNEPVEEEGIDLDGNEFTYFRDIDSIPIRGDKFLLKREHVVITQHSIDRYKKHYSDITVALKQEPLISKPLSNIERETLLIIIAALAKEAKVDIVKTSKAGDLIANMTQLIGAPIGATTIETHLKKINQAIVNRTK